jgi:hypothetical protein
MRAPYKFEVAANNITRAVKGMVAKAVVNSESNTVAPVQAFPTTFNRVGTTNPA